MVDFFFLICVNYNSITSHLMCVLNLCGFPHMVNYVYNVALDQLCSLCSSEGKCKFVLKPEQQPPTIDF
jgi:hypothetical protein